MGKTKQCRAENYRKRHLAGAREASVGLAEVEKDRERMDLAALPELPLTRPGRRFWRVRRLPNQGRARPSRTAIEESCSL